MAASARGRGPAGSSGQQVPGGAVLMCQWGHPWPAGSLTECWAGPALTSLPLHRLRMCHRDTELTSGHRVSKWTSFQGNAACSSSGRVFKDLHSPWLATHSPVATHQLPQNLAPSPKLSGALRVDTSHCITSPGREDLQPRLVSPGPAARTTHPAGGSLCCRPGVGHCVWRGRMRKGQLENLN